jgi:hypothetical protein
MLKIGLDLHGVIDDDLYMFSTMASIAKKRGHKIFVITGEEDGPSVRNQLTKCGMKSLYEGVLSITTSTTSHKSLGTRITFINGDETQPMMDPEIWNPTKAMLCASAGIDFMTDDSPIYGTYFDSIRTQYILYNDKAKELLKFLCFMVGHIL